MKTYKCQHCKKRKPAEAFYKIGQPARASPNCIACNSEANILKNYRSDARRDPRAFAVKMRKKENQLILMCRALKEVKA